MKRIFSISLTIFQIFLPFVLSYLSQRLSIGRGYEFKIINPWVLVLNFILWSAVFVLFLGIFKKNYQAIFFYLLFFTIFSIANRYKIKVLNLPLKINDLTWGKQLLGFVPLIIKHTNLKKELIASFGALFVSFFFLKHFFKFQIKRKLIRILFILVSFYILLLPYFNPKLFDQILSKTNILFHAWDAAENCRNNGMLLCFVHDEKYLIFPEPINYNQAKINQIYSDVKKEASEYNEDNKVKPNIIVIMSESFWDAVQFSETKYSKDPIKNVRSDIKSSFISPAFGGETANVEFELLTGFSNYFLPTNSYPYTQYIKKNIPSLFSLFKEKGYFTTAIHPYSQWFYNRDNVYRYFDVDKFTNLSNMSNYQNAGPFVSDKSFTKEVLNQLNSTDKSQFIFALSIQNHAPYEANRFPEHPITFQNSLNSADQSTLQSYIDGINLSDQSYSTLKTELNKIKKPTIIIFFGDHLPFLGGDFDIYKKENYNISDETKMHTTPISIWSNFKTNLNLPKELSPSFLSLEILKMANITPNYQFAFLNSLKETNTVLNQKISTNFTGDQLKNYELIQYDLIFGKQYGIK
ncbi:MAG: sulfatase-like hydrolase/transferase [Candidatus Shapirobacteria bacterium]|nr:sulfatase-like hydrolase/transferase [Candidatus Shapirobacteria bacterium]